MAYNYNLRLFKSRIAGNIEVDKKSNIIKRRTSIKNNECVTGEWVFNQYKKQNGICANPSCNHRLNNIFKEKEILGCWRVTSVNRVDNSIGHTKENCNLMHRYCNSRMENGIYGYYLFRCSGKKCNCRKKRREIFLKIGHPEDMDINKKRMKEIKSGQVEWYRKKRKEKIRERVFENKEIRTCIENRRAMIRNLIFVANQRLRERKRAKEENRTISKIFKKYKLSKNVKTMKEVKLYLDRMKKKKGKKDTKKLALLIEKIKNK